MRFHEGYTHVVAVGECAAGNETVGHAWLETKTFPKNTPISAVVEWAKNREIMGRLVITVDEPAKGTTHEYPPFDYPGENDL